MANIFLNADQVASQYSSQEGPLQYKRMPSLEINGQDVKHFLNISNNNTNNTLNTNNHEPNGFLGDFQPSLFFNSSQKLTNLTNFDLNSEERRYNLPRDSYSNFTALHPLPSIATMSDSHHGLNNLHSNAFNNHDLQQTSPPIATFAPNYSLYEENDHNSYLLQNGLAMSNNFHSSQTEGHLQQHPLHSHSQILPQVAPQHESPENNNNNNNSVFSNNNPHNPYIPSNGSFILPSLDGLYNKKFEHDFSMVPNTPFNALYDNNNHLLLQNNQSNNTNNNDSDKNNSGNNNQYQSASSTNMHCLSSSSSSNDTDPNDCGEKLNTREVALQIGSELKRYSIPQSVFAQQVLCRSQGTLSDLLRNPKPWSKLKSGRETFRRMWKWLQEPEYQRLATLRMIGKMSTNNRQKECSKDRSRITSNNNNINNNINNNSINNNNPVVPPNNLPHNNIPNNNIPINNIPNNNNSHHHHHHNNTKKPRLVFTDVQRRTLMAIFEQTRRPNKEIQTAIADQLGLKISTVANFFMNARRRSFEKYIEDDHTDNNNNNNNMNNNGNMHNVGNNVSNELYQTRAPSANMAHA